MTSAALQRASQFAEVDKRVVEILTLSPQMDPKRRRAALLASKKIGRRVRIRNLWTDLRRMTDKQISRLQGTAKRPITHVGEQLPTTGTAEPMRSDDSGNILQVDRYRRDGSLLAIDRRDARRRGHLGGRRITVFDRKGNASAQWEAEADFYHSWIDWVVDDRPATIISDSSPIGGMMHGYRRDNVILIQVLHNPHLKDPTGSPYGLLPPAKKEILTHLDRYDLVTTLTEGQRRDMLDSCLAVGKIQTVSNMYDGPIAERIGPRPTGRGVMVGRLVRQKRVEHAIEAMALVHETHPTAVLDIFGDGIHRQRLASLINDLEIGDAVRLHGYDADARAQFEHASFSILSSRFEGQGLVLLESLAAGCIPIAYDVPYGPSDIITHGVNGFLVPAGDTTELAATVKHVISLGNQELTGMREAALSRVADFAPNVITRRWRDVLCEAAAAKTADKEFRVRAILRDAYATDQGIHLALEVVLDTWDALDRALVAWVGRKTPAYGRVLASIETEAQTSRVHAVLPYDRFTAAGKGLLDVFLDVSVAGTLRRVRITAAGLEQAVGSGPAEIYATQHGNASIRLHTGRGRTADQGITRAI
ncbi:glycosyltransferase [Brevibacterium yomogidense]|uniref:glycosyltransferase n=1 Tax=Brevibacterium yomogidense TaxID=946573 RepID=UPI0018DF73EB|nr:glycosyltransferase [Brevibacterium yomogidense]